MKALHVTRDYPPRSHGGLSSAVAGWVGAGRTRGIGAAVVSFDAYRPRRTTSATLTHETGAVEVLRVEGSPEPAALLEFARQQRPDLVHLHDPLLLDVARPLRGALGVPLVVSVHVLQRALMALRGLSEPTRSAANEAHAVAEAHLLTVPSPSSAAHLRERYPHAVSAHVVPLAVETSGVDRVVTRPGPARVLFAGRFADVKGIDDFLAAAHRLAEHRPELRFELAGGLPASPRAERRFVRRKLEPLARALPGRLHWLGWCDGPALRAAYRRAHLLLAPSWSETFGQCAFDALAHATPVVTTDVGAYADYLEHGRECLKVPARDPRALADAAGTLLDDEARRADLARRGPESSARFSPERTGETLSAAYEAALARP